MGRLTNRSFAEKRPLDVCMGGGGGRGFCPVTFLRPLKNIDFLPLLVSKIYHTLPLYCVTVLFFLDTYVRNSLKSCFGKYSWYFVGGAAQAWHVFAAPGRESKIGPSSRWNWLMHNATHLNCWYGYEFEGNTCSRYFIMQINYRLNVWEGTFYSSILPHSWKTWLYW